MHDKYSGPEFSIINIGSNANLEGYSSVGLRSWNLLNGHLFESLKGHWRFTLPLTLGPRGIS